MAKLNLNYRASSLPALTICSGYDNSVLPSSKEEKESIAADNGTKRHALLSALIRCDDSFVDDLPASDSKMVHNAFNKIVSFIERFAPDAHIQSEVPIVGYDGNGIADVLAWDKEKKALVLLDFKSHESLKDYSAQVKWYARAWLQREGLDKVVKRIYTGIIFGDTGNMQIEELLFDELKHDINHIMAKVSDVHRKKIKAASPWCATCRKKGRCQIANDEIKVVAETLKHDEIPVADVADRLNEATEAEKRISELKKYAKELLEAGEELINHTQTFGYSLQKIVCFNIDFMEAYNHFSQNPHLLEAFFQKILITKTDVEKLLIEEFPDDPKMRSEVLKSLLGDATESIRLKRYLV